MKTYKACTTCGSLNVQADAWAEWDFATQQWTLSQTFDNAHCGDCEGETSIDDHEEAATFASVERDDDNDSRFRGVVRRGDAVLARTEETFDTSQEAHDAAGELDVE